MSREKGTELLRTAERWRIKEIADGLSKGTLDEEMIEWLQGQLDFEWDGKENFLVQFDKEAFNENNDDYTLLRAIYREQNDE